MATLQLIQALQAGLVNPTTGVALASGKCRFYDIGTLTPQTVYSDDAGATPITQPLTLTAGGVGTVYTAGPCRCIVKDSLDLTTIYDIAAVNGNTPATTFVTSASFNGGSQTTLQAILDNVDNSFGGRDWKYKVGTSERNLTDAIGGIHLTPQDYGAQGDGATDDTAAFAAMAAAQASSGKPVFIPKGIYMLSAVTTFTLSGAIVRGAGRSSICRGTNATMNMFSLTGIGSRVESLLIDHSATTSGTAIVFSNFSLIRDVVITAGDYTTAVNAGFQSHACDSDVQGITNATVGPWQLDNCVTAGAISSSTTYTVSSAINTGVVVQRSTADMANGGNTTPTASGTGVAIAYQRIRGTSAGSGTVNAPTTPATGAQILILDLYNNSGGAYTFNLNAIFHGSTSAPAPANGQHIVITYAWNATEAIWVMTGAPTASFA